MPAKNKLKIVAASTAALPAREEIVAAAFAIIAEKGLGKTRLSDLAARLDVSLLDLYQAYPSVGAIIAAFMDGIDETMLRDVAGAADSDKRDQYFDMMMSRLDAMQEHRAGVVRWLGDTMKQPTLWRAVLGRWEQSLSLMLDVAKDSPLFPVKKIGLAAVYLVTLRAWMRDDSRDMARTMAALDNALGRAEEFGNRFLTRKKPV